MWKPRGKSSIKSKSISHEGSKFFVWLKSDKCRTNLLCLTAACVGCVRVPAQFAILIWLPPPAALITIWIKYLCWQCGAIWREIFCSIIQLYYPLIAAPQLQSPRIFKYEHAAGYAKNRYWKAEQNVFQKHRLKIKDEIYEVDILQVVNLTSSALKMYVIVNVKCSQWSWTWLWY